MSHSISYYVGFVTGILFVVVFAFVVLFIYKKNCKKVKDKYDERQMLARGKAYKLGFFTLVFYMILISVAQTFISSLTFLNFMGVWVGICLAIGVFAVACIISDAYLSLAENPKQVIILFSIVFVANLFAGVNCVIDKPMIKNHILQDTLLNLVVAFLFFIILGVFIGKLLYNRKVQQDED